MVFLPRSCASSGSCSRLWVLTWALAAMPLEIESVEWVLPRCSFAPLSSVCGLAIRSWMGLCPGLPPFSPVVLLVGALFAAALRVLHRCSALLTEGQCPGFQPLGPRR